ncbi:putative membrane protein [Clostridium bornimense]|uniref:Putative membrane protein n=1 Tax=Clostridium bornimense TaxID=1216932 RepID=W6SH68_9CLOT|nr:FUSC family protein [Clostridium bornimense]CDM69020.1 putative membrane protein [Clostridium bornimense]
MSHNIIKKSNINVYSMVKNGTIAVITLLGCGIFFGVKNIMIAFPIALTSTVMGRQNLQVKTVSKIIKIMIIDILIVLASFLSSTNIYISVPINFISIFIIMYTIVSPYDLTFYKPFIMLYVFTQYASVSLEQLPLRIAAVIFGVLLVGIGSTIKKKDEKEILGNSIVEALQLIENQCKNIAMRKFDKDIEIRCSKIMRSVAYKVYVTRHKRYLTTYLGRIQFNLYINVEYLNISLVRVYEKLLDNKIDNEIIDRFLNIVVLINKYIKSNVAVDDILREIYILEDNIKSKTNYFDEEMKAIERILINIERLYNLNKKEINKIYTKWEKSDIDDFNVYFKEYFNRNSIRFKFSMRMAITLTISLYIGEWLGFYKIIWAIITIMSIMQPYYEDTILRAKERIRGNILAIIFTATIINLIDVKFITIAILIVSLYLLYGFKEYYKISLFAATASISIASLAQNINLLVFYRIIYVIIGVAFVVVANKLIFPYRLRDGVEQLKEKIDRLKNVILKSYELQDKEYIRDVIIHSTLLCEKLYLRNIQYKDENIDDYINKSNNLIINYGYSILYNSN